MTFWQAIILGLVEGLTEYLPVSSTGHLLVVQRLLGIAADDAANAYAIAIQGGAIAAVVVLYRRRLLQVAHGLLGRDAAGRHLAMVLAMAFVPAAVIGFLFEDAIEQRLFGPLPIAAAWAAGGILMLVVAPRVARTGTPLESITWQGALLVGLCQCAALWPGVSRSLATIMGGLAAGLSLVAAVEFSFLLGLLTLGAATAYKTLDSGAAMLQAYGPLTILVGFLAAWVSAMASVRWMVSWLQQHGLGVFGWWRLAAAAIVLVLVAQGVL